MTVAALSRPTVPSIRSVTILRHCRCRDCRHWIGEPHSECAHGIIRNGVSEQPEYPPDTWHYCALYHGPQISKDVWVWPKSPVSAKERPAPGRGGPSSGPMANRSGGGRSDQPEYRHRDRRLSNASVPVRPRAAHVAPRSKISLEADGEGDRSPASTLDRNM